MTNNTCLSGPSFSLSGNSTFTGQSVQFELLFDNEADSELVIAYQWYLDNSIIIGQTSDTFVSNLSCGNHDIGARILTTDGWSGVKSMAFKTCFTVVSVNLVGPDSVEQRYHASYSVIVSYSDGSTEDITNQYVLSCSGGSFTGGVFTPSVNHDATFSAAITATKAGAEPLTKQITIVGQPFNLALTGPVSVSQASSADYNIIANFADGSVENVTNAYTLSCPDGSFSGTTFTPFVNDGPAKKSVITASKNGSASLLKSITITTPGIIATVTGPDSVAQASSAVFKVMETLPDQNLIDVTDKYVLSCPDGAFSGDTFSPFINDGPAKASIITATKAGSSPLRKHITITTPGVAVTITGPDSVVQGSNATYTVIETLPDQSLGDITHSYVLSCPDGTFSGGIFTPFVNDGPQIASTINATKANTSPLTKPITIVTPGVIVTITGPDTIFQGARGDYSVIETLPDHSTVNETARYVLSCPDGTFTGSTFTPFVNNGSAKVSTIIATRTGSAAATKQITIATTATNLTLVGPDVVAEGLTATYSVVETLPDNSIADVTANYTLTSTDGTFSAGVFTANNVGASKISNINTSRNGVSGPQKQITIIGANPGILVVDILNDASLNIIALIENPEVASNHVAAHAGAYIVPTGSGVANALILASDLINQPGSAVRWRFQVNLAKLYTDYPGTTAFTIDIYGRATANSDLSGKYLLKTASSVMILTGSEGNYIPSVTGADLGTVTDMTGVVSDGANGSYEQNDLDYIGSFIYYAATGLAVWDQLLP